MNKETNKFDGAATTCQLRSKFYREKNISLISSDRSIVANLAQRSNNLTTDNEGKMDQIVHRSSFIFWEMEV